MITPSIHRAVLVEESMLVLNPRPDAIYIDGTLGGATHTEELLKRSAPSGRVFSFDVDLSAIERAKHTLAAYGSRWMPIEANFRHLDQELRQRNINQVDGILLDLGLSSDELADPTRGISFQQDGPLDMRLGPKANDDGLTAAEIVNTWQTKDLITLFRELGEERYALFIAKAIVSARRDEPIVTTQALVQIIKAAVPGNYEKGRIHPATRSFQALRIAVNDEIQVLKDAIKAAHSILRPDGVLAIISFHSLEDRIVKLAFKDQELWNVLTKNQLNQVRVNYKKIHAPAVPISALPQNDPMPNTYVLSMTRPHETMGLPMSQNRRVAKMSEGLWVSLMVVASLLCVGNYIYQVNKVSTKGFELRTLEKRVERLNEVVTDLENKSIQIQAVSTLGDRVAKLGYVPITQVEYLGTKGVAVK